MNLKIIKAGIIIGLIFFNSHQNILYGQDLQEKVKLCQGCHGINGKSFNSSWPNIANQNYKYLVKSLNDYKNNNRADPLMSPIAKSLSKEDIIDLAEYYSGK
ncbi:MAG: c-type cytochrome [Candidatus Marinimicrobia bacterium]|jgi:cytochrome c553|nr:c-type cytochrome [Candidatus Neomarinimicrobiota bacterium]MBT7472352.1 c-type cytochrome [Candidatus Neomarinimicrobiota bacterium]MBT7580967.1 c-type cytochrome [Candidatus Neomarinimicrobiota bacterium]